MAPVGSLGLIVPSGRGATLPLTSDHELAAQRAGQLLIGGSALGPEDDLRLAITIAQVDEQCPAVIAITIDPAAKRHGLSDVRIAQFAAGVGA